MKTELQEIEACLSRPSPSMMTMLFEDPANWAKKKSVTISQQSSGYSTSKSASKVRSRAANSCSSIKGDHHESETSEEYYRYYESCNDNGTHVEYDYENGSSLSSFDVNSFIASSGSEGKGNHNASLTGNSDENHLSPLLMYQMSPLMRPDAGVNDDLASEAARSGEGLTPIEEEDAK